MADSESIQTTGLIRNSPERDVIYVKSSGLDGGVYCAKCIGHVGNTFSYIEKDLEEEIMICDRCRTVIFKDSFPILYLYVR